MTELFNPESFLLRFGELMQNMESMLGASLIAIGERFAQFGALMQEEQAQARQLQAESIKAKNQKGSFLGRATTIIYRLKLEFNDFMY